MKTVLAWILGAIITIAVVWLLAFNGLLMGAYFGPKQEQVRRNTFERSKAYNDGMVQEIQAMQFQYEQADDKHKAALASIIRHRLAGYQNHQLPSEIEEFVRTLP